MTQTSALTNNNLVHGSQEVVKTSVAAFSEWRNELINSGVFQNYDNVHATYDKREVHALNKIPSFIHDNDENDGWAGDVDVAVAVDAPVNTVNGQGHRAESERMFAQKLDGIEADLLAQRINIGADKTKDEW